MIATMMRKSSLNTGHALLSLGSYRHIGSGGSAGCIESSCSAALDYSALAGPVFCRILDE